MDLISLLLNLLQIIIQYVLNLNQQQNTTPLLTTTLPTTLVSDQSTLNSNITNSFITTQYAFYSSILSTLVSDQLTSSSNITNPITSTAFTSNSNSDVTIPVQTTEKICPPGFLGANCEIECGITNFEQNQKIVGGKN